MRTGTSGGSGTSRTTVPAFRMPPREELCAEQLAVVELPTFEDHVIAGAKGTGKTTCALYRALKVSERCRDSVVLLCSGRSELLALRGAARGKREFDRITIDSWSAWLTEFYRSALHKKIPKIESWESGKTETDWGQVVRDSYAGVDHFGHILLDDAEEIPLEVVKAVGMAARYVTCFIDPAKGNVPEVLKSLLVESAKTLRGDFKNPYAPAVTGAGAAVTGADVIDLLEGTLERGLSLQSDRSLYLSVADLLAKLCLQEGDYPRALNYLMDLDDSRTDIPDSIHLSYLYAQIMTDGILRYAKDPVFLFRRLDRISPASFKERAALYDTFLKRLSDLQKQDPSRELNLAKFLKQQEKYTGVRSPQKKTDAPASAGTPEQNDDLFYDPQTESDRLKEALSDALAFLDDKKRVKALISDYFYDDPLSRNIYRAIVEDDIAKELSSCRSADGTAVMRYVMKLSGSRGIDRKLAERAILTWCRALSVELR